MRISRSRYPEFVLILCPRVDPTASVPPKGSRRHEPKLIAQQFLTKPARPRRPCDPSKVRTDVLYVL
jgi:hypothetical protein